MQHSTFNIVVPQAGGALIYNTATAAFAALDAGELAAYERCEDCSGGLLGKMGFLVPSQEAEIRSQREKFEVAKHDTSVLTLCIAPTYLCNSRCPYCAELYEKPRGVMTPEVQERIVEFAKRLHERDAFRQLCVQWYGGEPMLAFGVIEELSGRLIRFCAENGIGYQADLITNATMVTPESAARLRELGVVHAMPTLDGARQRQNARRPLRNGEDSFDATMAGIRALRQAGIGVDLMMNCDRNNIEDYEPLRSRLEEEGVAYAPTMLKDYAGNFGSHGACQGAFAAPEFDLMTRRDFCELQGRLLDSALASADDPSQLARALLAPAPYFCHGQLANYYAIDCAGDVYKCDGWMGKGEYALFNLSDDYDVRSIDGAVLARGGIEHACRQVDAMGAPAYNPYDDPECASCAVLPLCLGECAWDRELIGDSCHILKDHAAKIVRCLSAG